MIEVSNLGKKYGAFEAVRGVTFSIGSGEVVGLLGPNGAGKTTILKVLTGYHYPSYGKVSINFIDIVEKPLDVKSLIGYLPETSPLYGDLTVTEYLDFIALSRGLKGETKKNQIGWAVEECGLEQVMFKPIDRLSKGFRQRVGLAQAILHNPHILILDEPTSGLDPNQIIEIRKLIKKFGEEKTVILSTHILQEVEAVCEKVLILNEGRIVAGGTSEEIGRGMKGEAVLHVTIKGKPPDIIAGALSGLPAVRRIIKMSCLSKQCAAFDLSMQTGDDMGEVVFDWAVNEDLKIIEMTPEKMRLEDIFIKLTREGGLLDGRNSAGN
ncbi:MAG: ATP-binding cassette domain-containing protein [Spirochaetota bacterium]